MPQVFEITAPNGKTYEIEANDGVSQEQALQEFQALPETDWASFEAKPAAPASPKPQTPAAIPQVAAKEGDYELALDNALDFSPENKGLSRIDQRQLLAMINNPNISREQVNQFLTPLGRSYSEADWQQVEQGRGKGYDAVATDTAFAGMVDKEALKEEYAPESDGFFAQIGRSMLEGWSDPASLMNALDRAKLDFFDVYEDKLREQFPNATPEQLADLEEQYIGYMARLRGQAASEAVAEDDFVPWLIGQFGAIEPYDILPIGRVAKAGSKLGRAGEKFVEGAGIAAVGDVVGQTAAISDGAQDEFDPVRTAASAAISGTLASGGQALSDVLVRSTADSPAPRYTGEPIVVPTGDKRTKAYREQVVAAQENIIGQVNELTQGWTNSPKIEVHESFKKLDGVDNSAIGVYTTETLPDGSKVPVIKLNTEAVINRAKVRNVSPESVVEAVTFHESLGHHGLSSLFREDLDYFLADVYNKGGERLQDAVDTWLKKNPNAYKQFDEGQRLVLATEEVMAGWSEKGPIARTFYDNVANYIKDFARTRLGMDLKYSTREVKAYLAVAHERTMKGESVGATPSVDKNMNDNFDSKPKAPTPPPSGSGDKEWANYYAEASAYHSWKAEQREARGRSGENDRMRAASYMKSAQGRNPDAYGTLEVSDRAAYFRQQAKYHQKKMEERARRGDAKGIERHRLFRDDAQKKAAALSEIALQENPKNKYMAGDNPINPEDLSADDLIASKNAYDLIKRVEEFYEPTVVSPDQLEAEALARNLPPSDITRLVGMEPGKLMKKLFLYDVAATKLNDRAAKIKEDIDTQGLTPERQLAYIEAITTLGDLTAKIFDFQAEIGRTLAANRRVNFSRKRIKDLKAALEEYGMEALADPETFMRFMAEMDAKAAKTDKKPQFGEGVAQYINIPRAIMSSADLSAPLRQGIVFIGYKEYWKSFAKMFSYLGSNGKANYDLVMKKIATHPNYELMLKGRLQFSSLDGELSAREEDFQTEIARNIPLFGKVVKGSEQAYAGFLNKLRADMFNRLVEDYRKAGIEPDEDMLKGIGKFINAGTGRAELPEFLRPSSTILNATFFSARLMHSRVQMLNPAFYASLPPKVRIEAGKSMLKFGSIALLVNGALNALFPEVETELDPRSSDFMKVKVGNTRFDLGGGFNQYLTLAARTASWLYNQSLEFGERIGGIDTTDYRIANRKTSGGDFSEFGAEKMTQDTYLSVLGDFFRSKLSPQTSYVVDAMAEKDYIGRPFTLEGSLASRLVPMTASSLYEAYNQDSPVPMPVIFTAALFGVGVNTYTPPSMDPKRELEAPPSFQMSDLEDGSNEYIVAKDGEVTLKKEARDRWTATLNNYYAPYVEEVAAEAGVKFEDMDDEMKKDTTEEALKRTRAAAKADMMYELGLADE